MLGLSVTAPAQARERSEGLQGSEYGKGGSERIGVAQQFSLAFDWGVAIESDGQRYNGAPLFLGLTASYWTTDWFLLDASANYLLSSKKFDLLFGPRFRTVTYPFSFVVGLKAGPIFFNDSSVRLGISPQAGFDLVLQHLVLLGLSYAPDIPLGDGGVSHRILMSIGYRF